MADLKHITIAGGGLAGLTLGIGLRQRGVPVTVIEAGHYPRHRVCGEFMSGGGQAVLARLGLQARVKAAGAVEGRTAAFFTTRAQSPVRELAHSALCISRHTLDSLLAREFVNLGGELRTGTRSTFASHDEVPGLVRATGRQPGTRDHSGQWFGLKAHATGVNLAADMEMHIGSFGYIGAGVTSGGAVNVCGLFRRRPAEASANHNAWELLRGEPGSLLHGRMGGAQFDPDSFTAVAGVSLRPHQARDRGVCCVGDTVTMIPPVTGNGMSMALEAAELAAAPLAAYSGGELAWPDARRQIATDCDTAFARRLRWARLLQWLMFSPIARSRAADVLLRSDWFWDALFERTR